MSDLLEQLNREKDYIVGLRREFHQYPELSLQEFRTAKRIEEELDKSGISHSRVGETGVPRSNQRSYRKGKEQMEQVKTRFFTKLSETIVGKYVGYWYPLREIRAEIDVIAFEADFLEDIVQEDEEGITEYGRQKEK